MHPQTLITYGMNGGDLPVGHGGPLRLRVPRQLGYKSVKYIAPPDGHHSLKGFGVFFLFWGKVPGVNSERTERFFRDT